ncbi:MAG TPA: hypothetical protein VK465_02115 [Fibrobacteria bacterium]|nr:hypothetical protein [Fibrobacteria bacterium]
MEGLTWTALALLGLQVLTCGTARADRLVLKDGKVIFGTVTDEKDSLVRYFDRYDRPRKLAASALDTLIYDAEAVQGLVKVAFRKGRPGDRSGLFRLRHSEELDLEAEYRTDSLSELDLFFRNDIHVRMLPGSYFKVLKAAKGKDDRVEVELFAGRALVTSAGDGALVRVFTPGGVGVGRGVFQFVIRSHAADSSLSLTCLRGLCGTQASRDNPGELVVEAGGSMAVARKDGIFQPGEPDSAEVKELAHLAAQVGHYRFSPIEYPRIGYLPRAITGFGFMLFFYGSAIGILDYVNNI